MSQPDPMRVALCFPGFHRRGGVERIMLECGLFLRGRGHSVVVYANEWDEEVPGIEYVRVPMRSRPWFLRGDSFFRNATDLTRAGDFDVLNPHGCVCPTGGVMWVQSVQKAWLEQSERMRGRFSPARLKQRLNPLHPYLLRLEKIHYEQRQYKKLIVTTPQVRDDLRRLYQVPLSDMEIVPNGFAPDEFNPARRQERRAEMRRQIGLREDDIALLFVANELERKGYPVLLQAMRQLQNPRLKLVVIGRPPVDAVKSQAAEAGLQDQVIASGSTRDVSGFHAAADIFVLPTQYEAFCLAILEALGSGLPVVTTKVPGAGDAIIPGVNGLLMDDPLSADELAAHLSALADDSTRERIAAAAAPSAESYQWPRVLERYEAILQANRR